MRKLAIAVSAAICVCFAAIFIYEDSMQSPSAPVPLVKSGYYENEFTLCFETPAKGTTIYYTLDGSTPNQNSEVYRDGIAITDKNCVPNIYNVIPNVIMDYEDYEGIVDPVEKATVVRAVTISDWGYSSDIITQTYFIGIEEPEDAYAVSLVFDYDNLFGDDGIYVTGEEYDEWYLNTDRSGEAPVPNFQQQLETSCIVEMIQDGESILNQSVGIRIQGASSRLGAKKRFILVAREEYSNSKYFAHELYDGVLTHSIMLKGRLGEAIVSDLMKDRSVSTQKSKVAKVYLNGEYWYDTYMLERYDKTYFKEYYEVDNPVVIKNAHDIDGIESHNEMYSEFLSWVNNTDLSFNTNWEELNTKIDLQSYIDYITINYYLDNWDFTETKNYVLWRSEETNGNGYNDGRWRWCVFDIDLLDNTLGYFSVQNAAEVNIFSCDSPFINCRVDETPLFKAFYKNNSFRRQFVLSFMDMLNNNFNTERVSAILEKYGYDLSWMDGYFEKRPKYAKLHLADEFKLTGSVETVTITTMDPNAGNITVNTSQINLSDGEWTGEYFTDYPITVTAVPNKGYTFIGWEGDITSRDASIEVSVDGGLKLQACFERQGK